MHTGTKKTIPHKNEESQECFNEWMWAGGEITFTSPTPNSTCSYLVHTVYVTYVLHMPIAWQQPTLPAFLQMVCAESVSVAMAGMWVGR